VGGGIRNYYPDFVARDAKGVVWIIETKGREDVEDARKFARLPRRPVRRSGACWIAWCSWLGKEKASSALSFTDGWQRSSTHSKTPLPRLSGRVR
jgi:hypothetical protein